MNIVKGDVVVNLDYSENYKVRVWDEVSDAHYHQMEWAVLPMLVYWRDGDEVACDAHTFICADSDKKDGIITEHCLRWLMRVLRLSLGADLQRVHSFSDSAPTNSACGGIWQYWWHWLVKSNYSSRNFF